MNSPLTDEKIDADAKQWQDGAAHVDAGNGTTIERVTFSRGRLRLFARAIEAEVRASVAAPAGAPGSTDAERAAWLADKIVAQGDYAKEAAQMLMRWPAASPAAPVPPARQRAPEKGNTCVHNDDERECSICKQHARQFAAMPATLPDLYISGPYTVGNNSGRRSVCELATARVVGYLADGVEVPGAKLVNGQWEGKPLSDFPELQRAVRQGIDDGTLVVQGAAAMPPADGGIVGWVRDENDDSTAPPFLRGPVRPPRDLKANYRPVVYDCAAPDSLPPAGPHTQNKAATVQMDAARAREVAPPAGRGEPVATVYVGVNKLEICWHEQLRDGEHRLYATPPAGVQG